MGNQDEADIKRQNNTADFLDKNKNEFAGFIRLENGIVTLNNLRAQLAQQIEIQTTQTTGITAQKSASFNNLSDKIMKLVRKALVWATDKQNMELVTLFNFSATSFKSQSKLKAIIQAKAVVAAFEANAQEFLAYNITAVDIQALKDKIAEAEATVNAPTKASSTRSTATIAIKTLIKFINSGYDTLEVLIVNEYADTKPNFVNGFLSSWTKDTKGIRHTGLSATITDAATGKAIGNATLAIAGLNKTATSNIAGLAEIIKMKAGSYRISISADGYTTQLMDVTVPKSKTLELAVTLELA